jgi:bifunctional UDP-N-acetylglucosamine pyrophosphorylase/glucosamine-1-phosphate N-acetyltransferase
MDLASVILAAGQGTRMRSNRPKVLHPIAGRPMVQYSIQAVSALESRHIVLVVGYGADEVRAAIGDTVTYVVQREQRGTGHAVLQAEELLRGRAEAVLVIYGDMPLLRAETLGKLVDSHAASRPAITMLTVTAEESMGFGRILRDADRQIMAIVEESDASPAQLAIHELNCGVYCFDSEWLWEHLPRLTPSGKKNEYYLTDLVGMAVGEKSRVESITLADAREVIGVNTRVHLAQAGTIMRERINTRLLDEGATITDPATAYIDIDVQIGPGTVVEPCTYLRGHTRIGSDCVIGPNSILIDTETGDGCQVIASMLEEAVLERNVHVGPFAHLRPGTHLESGVHVGNHAEIKNSRLSQGVHVGHFSYIGDSEIGARTNIGAGTVTCNFDGEKKNRTLIGEDVFVGSDTMLVAPVRVGARAKTGAGSVVTKDVPPDSVAAGVPARVIRKLR